MCLDMGCGVGTPGLGEICARQNQAFDRVLVGSIEVLLDVAQAVLVGMA
jgi:hypothetical protein